MRRIAILFIILCVFLISCGTTRFSFDRTERNIVELGGKYDKKVEEEIKKLYETDGLDEVIKEVYNGTYTAIDVEGYLGEDIWKQYEKRIKELSKEIEEMRKTEGLDEIVSAVLDETYPEALIIEVFGGPSSQLAMDFEKNLEEKTALRDKLRGILEESGYEGIKNALINGEYDEETIEEYLGESTLEEAKKIYAKETGTDGFAPLKKSENSDTETMEFVSSSETASKGENKEETLIVQIVTVVTVIIVAYILSAVARSLNKGPLSNSIAIPVSLGLTVLSIGLVTLITGWSIYYLAFLLIIPTFFVLTAETNQ